MKISLLKTVIVSSALALTNCGVEEQAQDGLGQPTADIQSTTSALTGCYPVGTYLKTTQATSLWVGWLQSPLPADCTLILKTSCPTNTIYTVHAVCTDRDGSVFGTDVALK